MTIVFDLDYTLIDTAAFKEALAASLESCGVARRNFWETYEQTSKATEKICDYEPERHLEALAGRMSCGKNEALRRIESVVDRMPEFIMPGAIPLLDRLASRAKRVLFTHGNVSWQKRKVARSGLADRFDEMIFASEEKMKHREALGRLEPPVVMVNDDGREIDDLRKAFPEFRMIAVRGPKPLPTDPSASVCENLEEVYKKIMER